MSRTECSCYYPRLLLDMLNIASAFKRIMTALKLHLPLFLRLFIKLCHLVFDQFRTKGTHLCCVIGTERTQSSLQKILHLQECEHIQTWQYESYLLHRLGLSHSFSTMYFSPTCDPTPSLQTF